MKLKLIIFILILFSIAVSATIDRECLDRAKPGMNCSIIVRANCTTERYTLINATDGDGSVLVIGNPLLSINSAYKLCYATLNRTEGDYVFIFNETNQTRIIVVDGNTNDQIITEVDAVEENQATLLSRILDIFYWLFGTKTEVYYNNSLGYPTYDITTYSTGNQSNRTYNYRTDNMTIKNTSAVLI